MFEIVFEICAMICSIVLTGVLTYVSIQLGLILVNDFKDSRGHHKEMKIEMFDEIEPK